MTITEKAFAKLNLCLKVGEKMPNGYHEVETVMQSCSLADVLSFTSSDDGLIELSCSDKELPTDKGNLVYRAAEAFFAHTGLKNGVKIHLSKLIPKAAGLGGGSADAAATVRGLNRLFKAGLSYAELEKLVAPLGADVPFCVRGGTCSAVGIGNLLSPLPELETLNLVVAADGEGIATPLMYSEFDRFPEKRCAVNYRLMLDYIMDGETERMALTVANSFSAIAKELRPKISAVIEELKAYGALCAEISGTGPSVFGIFRTEQRAKEAAAALNAKGIFAKPCFSTPALDE